MPLHVQEMQQIYKYPVFSQLIPVPSIHIHYPHICIAIKGGHAQIAACRLQAEIRPAEKAAIIAFGHPADMAIKPPPFILGSERALMLLNIALDGIAGANAGWPPPNHVIMPALAKLFLRGGILPLIYIAYHPVDQR